VHLIGKGDDVDDLPDHLARMPVICVDRPLGHELLRRIRQVLDTYPHQPMMVGEVYLLEPGQAATYLGSDEPGEGELHLSFDFRPVHTRWEPVAMHRTIAAAQHDFAEPHWPTWVLSNHDQPRHRTRYGTEARARAAAVLSLTVRGTPFLYAGEELGLADATIPADRIVDPDGRDGCRAPIPWTADGDAASGHGWPTPPWLPFPDNATEAAAARQHDDPGSMLALYRQLLALRRAHQALHSGAMDLHPLEHGTILFERRHDDERIVVAVNLTDQPVPLPPAVAGGELLASSDPTRASLSGTDLAADEAVVAYAP
jgi:alpha-glucosidase